MKLLIIGAGKGVGLAAATQALAASHEVTVLTRSADSLPLRHPSLRAMPGSVHDATAVSGAVAGQHAVILSPGLGILALKRDPTFFSRGTALVLGAMRQHGVPRLVILSNLAAGDGEALLNPLERLFTHLFIRAATDDHTRQELLASDAARAWGLQWVVARASRLTNGAAKHRYQVVIGQRVPSSISRADVAHFLLQAATTDQWLNRAWNVGG